MSEHGQLPPRCYWLDCEEDADRLCGICDGWFCKEHDDHDPIGDAGHGESEESYRKRLNERADRLIADLEDLLPEDAA